MSNKYISGLKSSSAKKKINGLKTLESACLSNRSNTPEALKYIIPMILDKKDSVRMASSKTLLILSRKQPSAFAKTDKMLRDFLNRGFDQHDTKEPFNWIPFARVIITVGNYCKKLPKLGVKNIELITRPLKYPLYHPERPEDGLHYLYATAVKSIGSIGCVNPPAVKEAIQFVYKALVDSYRFYFWRNKIEKKEEDMKYMSIKTLTSVGLVAPTIVIPPMSAAFLDKDRKIIETVTNIFWLLTKNLDKLFPALMTSLDTDQKKRREHLTDFIIEVGEEKPKFMITNLIKRMKDERRFVRIHSAVAIGQLVQDYPQFIPHVMPIFIHNLEKDKEMEARQTVSDSLTIISAINPDYFDRYVPQITVAMGDPYHHVRWRMAQIIKNVGIKRRDLVYESIPYLIAGLEDKHEHVKWKCEEALEALNVDKIEYRLAIRSIKIGREMLSRSNEFYKTDVPEARDLLKMSADLARHYCFSESIKKSQKAKQYIEIRVPQLGEGGKGGGAQGMRGGPMYNNNNQFGYPQQNMQMQQQWNQQPMPQNNTGGQAPPQTSAQLPQEEPKKAIAEKSEPVVQATVLEGEFEEEAFSWKDVSIEKIADIGRYRQADDVDFEISDAEKVEIESGYAYLLEDSDRDTAYELFSKVKDQDQTGLFITRNHPRKIIRKFNLKASQYLWLTKMDGANNVRPDNIESLKRKGERFLSTHQKDIMLIEGIEYLFSHNNFDEVIDLVRFFKDLGSVTDSILIISGAPSVLKKQEFEALKREVDTVI